MTRPIDAFRGAILGTIASLGIAATALAAEDAAGTAKPDQDAVAAATAAGVSPDFIRAFDVAMARINQSLSHDEVAQLNLLAYAAAASGLCADLELDEGAVYKALTASAHESLEGATEEEAQTHKDFSLIAFGILTGLILENAASQEGEFCKEAVQYSAEVGADAFLKKAGQ